MGEEESEKTSQHVHGPKKTKHSWPARAFNGAQQGIRLAAIRPPRPKLLLGNGSGAAPSLARVAQVRERFNVARLRLTVLGLRRRCWTSQRLNCLRSVGVILAGFVGSPLTPWNQAAKESRSDR